MDELSLSACEALAGAFLDAVVPQHLAEPQALDLVDLVDHRLPRVGIEVHPVHRADEAAAGDPMPRGAMADCRRASRGRIVIRVLAGVYRAMRDRTMSGPYQAARVVVGHDLGHVYHVGWLRGSLGVLDAPRIGSPRHCDPEWQADVIGGSILVPRHTLLMLPEGAPLEDVARIYEVPCEWLAGHLHELGLTERHPRRADLRGPAKWQVRRVPWHGWAAASAPLKPDA